jgi:RND family efflux transporter MFP subunit
MTVARFAAFGVFMRPVLRPSVVVAGALLVTGALAAGACREATPASAASSATVQLSPENVVTATVARISSGPTISGQLTPAREAKVRAQVGGSLVALAVDRGEPVRTGMEIARISSRDLESSLASSQAAVKSAESAVTVANAELQRTESLVKGGALAERDLEQARNAAATAEAQLAAARAREQSAWQQLDDTSVKAPFSGIVSERPASLGDVVSPGTEILTIVDPSSLRLEALVPSDRIGEVRRGAAVHFSIRGVAGDFVGRVDRLSPSADPVTRQVSVFVSVPNTSGKLIAGAFVEGRIEVSTREGVVVPLAAVDETGAVPTITRVKDGKAERATVTLGVRRNDTEEVEVVKGVAPGDVLIVGSQKGVAAGTPVKVVG